MAFDTDIARHRRSARGAAIAHEAPQPQKNIYVGPGKGFPDSLVRFVVEFVNDSGGGVENGDKMVEIRASGGQLAWSQPFAVNVAGRTLFGPKDQTKVVSARLWNDQTFEYSIFAGVRFVSRIQGQPVKTFYSKRLTFKLPRRGIIRLRMVLAEKQHQSGFLQPTVQAGQAALTAFRALYPKLGVGGINEAMVNTTVIRTRNPTTKQVNLSFFYLTGDVKLEVAPQPKAKP